MRKTKRMSKTFPKKKKKKKLSPLFFSLLFFPCFFFVFFPRRFEVFFSLFSSHFSDLFHLFLGVEGKYRFEGAYAGGKVKEKQERDTAAAGLDWTGLGNKVLRWW